LFTTAALEIASRRPGHVAAAATIAFAWPMLVVSTAWAAWRGELASPASSTRYSGTCSPSRWSGSHRPASASIRRARSGARSGSRSRCSPRFAGPRISRAPSRLRAGAASGRAHAQRRASQRWCECDQGKTWPSRNETIDRRPERATRQSCSRAGLLRALARDPRDTPWLVAFSPRFFTAASRLVRCRPHLPQKEFGDWRHKEQIGRSIDGSIVMYYWHCCWD
jgi:hypothetical protein